MPTPPRRSQDRLGVAGVESLRLAELRRRHAGSGREDPGRLRCALRVTRPGRWRYVGKVGEGWGGEAVAKVVVKGG